MNAKTLLETLFTGNSNLEKGHGITWQLVASLGRIGWDLGQEFTKGKPMPLLETQDHTLQFKPKDSMPLGLFPVYLTGDCVITEDSHAPEGS